MNASLQDAITATRDGNKKEAQLLLAQNLKENPDDVQSWYLLSMLVDSKEKQALYLSKALALDPEHEKAKERLETIRYAKEAAANMTISGENEDFVAQAEGDTLPDWLAEDSDSLQLDKIKTTALEEEEGAPIADVPVAESDEQFPQWLQENVSESWIIQEPPTQISITTPEEGTKPESTTSATPETTTQTEKPKKKKAKPRKPRTKKEEKTRLNWILGGLIIAMILVFLVLIFIAL